MENLKIRVATEAESKEAQELFFELGYPWSDGKDIFDFDMPEYIVNWNNGYITVGDDFDKNRQEITLAELRDMVNPVKEYLFKHNYQYTLVELSKEDAGSNPEQYIEIPEGCNIITCENRNGNLVYFHWKSLDSDEFFLKAEKIWTNNFNETLSDFIEKNEGDVKIIWSRHTQPEELPLIDDEPKIETATGYQLDVVGKNTYGSRSRKSGESDTSYRQYLMNFKIYQSQSLNDQYAEIEQVRKQTIEATLAERQAQYGCFEDVAFVTENIMATLSKVRVNGLSDLPHPHRMALYMIASKMARIVNGDYNHKDSWHDIGGYSKLIEDLL